VDLRWQGIYEVLVLLQDNRLWRQQPAIATAEHGRQSNGGCAKTRLREPALFTGGLSGITGSVDLRTIRFSGERK
jgi:hypothetical protein